MEVKEFAGRSAARLNVKCVGIVPQRGAQEVGCEPLELLGCVLNENVTVIKGAPSATQERVRDGLEMSSRGAL